MIHLLGLPKHLMQEGYRFTVGVSLLRASSLQRAICLPEFPIALSFSVVRSYRIVESFFMVKSCVLLTKLSMVQVLYFITISSVHFTHVQNHSMQEVFFSSFFPSFFKVQNILSSPSFSPATTDTKRHSSSASTHDHTSQFYSPDFQYAHGVDLSTIT